jgi:hypothetical protein
MSAASIYQIPLMPTRFLRTLAVLLAALSLAAQAGCGFLSDDDEPLPGVYASDEFRIQDTTGRTVDVGEAGGALELTLTDDGQVTDGRLTVPAEVGGANCPSEASLTGTYQRSGDQRVTFDYETGALVSDCFGNTGTPLAEVPFEFYENDGTLRAVADGYVLFLDREGDGGEASDEG